MLRGALKKILLKIVICISGHLSLAQKLPEGKQDPHLFQDLFAKESSRAGETDTLRIHSLI